MKSNVECLSQFVAEWHGHTIAEFRFELHLMSNYPFSKATVEHLVKTKFFRASIAKDFRPDFRVPLKEDLDDPKI